MPPAAPSCPTCGSDSRTFLNIACVRWLERDGARDPWHDEPPVTLPAAPEGVVPLWRDDYGADGVFWYGDAPKGESAHVTEWRALPVAAYAALVKSNEDARALREVVEAARVARTGIDGMTAAKNNYFVNATKLRVLLDALDKYDGASPR